MTHRITDYRDLLFGVRTVPVYAKLPSVEPGSMQPIPGKMAVVNCIDNSVISVVSKGYQLVPNTDALRYARQCCEAAFPDLPSSEWEVSGADAPKSCGHCHIDLRHNTAKLDFSAVAANEKPDTYGPYIRVTNSYNQTRALRFEIGFMRKVCSNGLVLPESSVRFALTHNTRRIPERLKFHISQPGFENIRGQFQQFLRPLRDCRIPRARFAPIASAALQIRKPRTRSGRAEETWFQLQWNLERLCDKYVVELGETAYALLNVITDVASRPLDVGLKGRERSSLQRRAGVWLADFSKECRKADFHLDRYVEKCRVAVKPSADPVTQPAWGGSSHGLPRM